MHHVILFQVGNSTYGEECADKTLREIYAVYIAVYSVYQWWYIEEKKHRCSLL